MATSIAAMFAFCSLDVAGIRIRHGRRRLVHRVGDQHQRFAGCPGADGRDQVSHSVVTDIGKADGEEARRDRGLDEGAQLRLRLHQRRLRARHAHELDEQRLAALRRDELAKLGELCGDVAHGSSNPRAAGKVMPSPFAFACSKM
jgi:hypothetical protein